MGTRLEWTRDGLKLVCETSTRALPSVLPAPVEVPDFSLVASSLLSLSLEDVAGTTRKAIRIKSADVSGLPHTGPWSLWRASWVGTAPAQIPWVEVQLGEVSTISHLLADAQPGANHAFFLKSRGASYPQATISTPADSILASVAAAQSTADAAQADLARIASDAWLTRGEKAQALMAWNDLNGSKADLVTKAAALSVSSTAWVNAWQALGTYLNGGTAYTSGTPSWLADTANDTAIVASTWNTTWGTAYTERVKLINAIEDAVRSKAQTALDDLARIASDGWLSRGEKAQSLKDWNDLNGSKADLVTKAAAVSVDSTAWVNAWQTLGTYLNNGTTYTSGVPAWLSDTASDTAITASTWNTNWSNAYTERTKLQNAIADKIRQNAADAATAAANAAPIVVSALPAIGTVPEGKLAWVTGSSPARMYQARGGAWVELGVQASAIFGQLVAGQLSAGIIAALISSGEVIYTSNFAAHTGGTSYTGSSLGTTTPATVDAGALLRNGGSGQPPLLVASDGMLVGSTLIGEALLRTLSMYSTNGGSVAGGTWRAFYRGNSTGAPVAARLKITPLIATSDSARQIAEWELVVQPTATTDNLDALSYVEMEFYSPSYSTSGPYATRRYGIGGRNYYTLFQEDQALNAVYGHAVLTHATVKPETSNAYQGYIRARLVGVQGPGDWLWYSPGSNGTPITGSTSTPSALSGAPASGGGSTGSGGKVIQPQI